MPKKKTKTSPEIRRQERCCRLPPPVFTLALFHSSLTFQTSQLFPNSPTPLFFQSGDESTTHHGTEERSLGEVLNSAWKSPMSRLHKLQGAPDEDHVPFLGKTEALSFHRAAPCSARTGCTLTLPAAFLRSPTADRDASLKSTFQERSTRCCLRSAAFSFTR